MKNLVNTQVTPLTQQMKTFLSTGNEYINIGAAGAMVLGTSQWIYSMGLLIIASIQLIFMLLLLFGRRTAALKACTGSFIVGIFWFMFFVRGILEFAMSTILGDGISRIYVLTLSQVCLAMDMDDSSFLSAVSPDLPKYLQIGDDTLELCLNSSLISVLENSGIHELIPDMSADDLSLSKIVDDEFAKIDWNQTVNDNTKG